MECLCFLMVGAQGWNWLAFFLHKRPPDLNQLQIVWVQQTVKITEKLFFLKQNQKKPKNIKLKEKQCGLYTLIECVLTFCIHDVQFFWSHI